MFTNPSKKPIKSVISKSNEFDPHSLDTYPKKDIAFGGQALYQYTGKMATRREYSSSDQLLHRNKWTVSTGKGPRSFYMIVFHNNDSINWVGQPSGDSQWITYGNFVPSGVEWSTPQPLIVSGVDDSEQFYFFPETLRVCDIKRWDHSNPSIEDIKRRFPYIRNELPSGLLSWHDMIEEDQHNVNYDRTGNGDHAYPSGDAFNVYTGWHNGADPMVSPINFTGFGTETYST